MPIVNSAKRISARPAAASNLRSPRFTTAWRGAAAGSDRSSLRIFPRIYAKSLSEAKARGRIVGRAEALEKGGVMVDAPGLEPGTR